MSPRTRLSLVDPATLPHVWRVEDLACEQEVLPSGHAALDKELPGGGWPVGSIVEVLHHAAGQHAWQLVLPALSMAIQRLAGPVLLVGSPHVPFGPSLQAQGLPGNRLLWVRAEKPSARLWAAEQALRCAEVAAVLAWLPQARGAELRRLQMAAQQQSRLLFVFRDVSAMSDASPARLRLLVEGNESLQVQILKRRGPPQESPVILPAHPAKLAALLKSRKSRVSVVPVSAPAVADPRRSRVLDSTAATT